MGETKIEWTEKVWNPVTGCSKVSAGCKNCYAERMSKCLAGRAGYPEDGFKVTLHEDKLAEPLRWKKPSRIFVCSMGDIFHVNVPFAFVDKIIRNIRLSPQHTFLVLTKRPHFMKEYFEQIGDLDNLWLGVSVEDQKTADARIPLLLQTPAAKRFVSYEPVLGPVDFTRITMKLSEASIVEGTCRGTDGRSFSPCGASGKGIDWLIMGGESGPGARPMHPDWARSVRDQCQEACVPFFFKQWGEWGTRGFIASTGEPVFRMFENFQQWVNKASTWINGGACVDMTGKNLENGKDFKEAVYPVAIMHRVGKVRAGCLLDGKEHKETL